MENWANVSNLTFDVPKKKRIRLSKMDQSLKIGCDVRWLHSIFQKIILQTPDARLSQIKDKSHAKTTWCLIPFCKAFLFSSHHLLLRIWASANELRFQIQFQFVCLLRTTYVLACFISLCSNGLYSVSFSYCPSLTRIVLFKSIRK